MRLLKLGASLLALLVVACGGETVTVDPQTEGTLQLPLTATSDGKVYRLVGATFKITGTDTVTVTDTTADTVQTSLSAGSYTVELAGTWKMERVDAPGIAVPAQLLSPNPLPFLVTKGETSVVRFQFKLPGNGTADVGIQVDSGGWLAGTLHFDTLDSPYTEGAWAELVGKDIPFLISFESATYVRETYGSKMLTVQASAATVQFGGPPSALLQRAAASLKGSPFMYSLRSYGTGNRIEFAGMFFQAPPTAFRFELMNSGYFEGALDVDGYPALQPFEFQMNGARLMDSNGHEGVRGTADVNGSP